MEALILFVILWGFGSWLADKAEEFKGIEERMTLRAENVQLRLALETSEDDRPDLEERAERIQTTYQGEHGDPGRYSGRD